MPTALAALLASLVLAAEPPASPAAPPAPGGSGEAPSPELMLEPPRWTVGLDVLVPRQSTGRLMEYPFSLAVETSGTELGPVEGAIRFALGYAQLSRTDACATADCYPMLGGALGALVRLGTRREKPLVGWLSLGAGFQGASNWDLSVAGLYVRADAGFDLGGNETQRLRLSVGWVEGWYTEDRPELEPGHQRYLAFTLAFGPGKSRAPDPVPVAPR